MGVNALMDLEVSLLSESFTASLEFAYKLARNEEVSSLEVHKKSLLALIIFIAMRTFGYLYMVLINLFLESFKLSLKFLNRFTAERILNATIYVEFFVGDHLLNKVTLSLA